ncbi:helix-turn-helix domain-containing protein [Ferrovibrio terrae]|uniref:helix-turn-helix domain-containing protein n=1 Tax=Ferrovibrio terrae TaxID=2594003 RepID=UPI003137F30E
MQTPAIQKSPIDAAVGARLKAARKLAGLSQSTLGGKVGISFQQVQKYEKGFNRIGASRMQQFAEILNVAPSFFFGEGAHAGSELPMLTADELSVIRDYRAIPVRMRPQVRGLLSAMGSSQAVPA